MTLLFHIDDLLYELFPEANGERKALVEAMTARYTVAGIAPRVRMENDTVVVELDVERLSAEVEARYQDAFRECARGRFERAKPNLQQLAREVPWHADIQATLGQVH